MISKSNFNRKWLSVTLFAIVSAIVAYAQPAMVPWGDHYTDVLPDGIDPWHGPVAAVEGPTSVVVQQFELESGLLVEVFYPSAQSRGEGGLPAVLFVSGTSDTTVRNETGRPWMHSSQAMGWGRLAADNGFVALTYENDGRPTAGLQSIGEWLTANAETIGVDLARVGTWSCSSQCRTAIEVFREGHEAFAGIRPAFGVFYYGDLSLRRDHDTAVPLLVVRVANDAWADGHLMERFVERLRERGGTVEFLTHESGSHAFDVKEPTTETLEIMNKTIQFMKTHAGT